MTQTRPGGCPAFVVAAEGYDRLIAPMPHPTSPALTRGPHHRVEAAR